MKFYVEKLLKSLCLCGFVVNFLAKTRESYFNGVHAVTRILFGQSYYLRFDPKLWQAMQPYPPLGTLYAAAYVRQRGYEVAFFDAMLAESENEWAQALDRHSPDFAVI